MSNDALLFLNIYFLGRLFFYAMERVLFGQRQSKNEFFVRLLFGGILFLSISDFSMALALFLFYLLLVVLDTFILFPKTWQRSSWYAVLLLFSLSSLFWPLEHLNNWFPIALKTSIVPLIPAKALLILLGYILTIKEGTIIIRLILNSLKTVPQTKTKKEDAEEYERGKWIGILERTFVYFLIIFNQIGAIAIIIALKSLARFNELNDKTFAEYFLIGSFLSLLVSAFPAVVVRLLW